MGLVLWVRAALVAVPPLLQLTAAPSGGCGEIQLAPSVRVINADAEAPAAAVDASLPWHVTQVLPCINDEESYHERGDWTYDHHFTVGIAHDPSSGAVAEWDRHARTDSNACFVAATNPCFRGVFDVPLPESTIAELQHAESSEHRSEATEILQELMAAAIEEQFGVGKLTLQLLHVSWTEDTDEFNGQLMHTDLVSNDQYWYTALLYISEAGTDFDHGGHSIFVDRAEVDSEGVMQVTEGLAVAPRPGRVVVFSGGLENVHGRLPIGNGVRKLVQLWYRCADTEHPQGGKTRQRTGGVSGRKSRRKRKTLPEETAAEDEAGGKGQEGAADYQTPTVGTPSPAPSEPGAATEASDEDDDGYDDFMALFQQLDGDGDGFLSQPELELAGDTVDFGQLANADTDGDGQVGPLELWALLSGSAEDSDNVDATEQSDADSQEPDDMDADNAAYPNSHIMTDEEEREMLALVMGGSDKSKSPPKEAEPDIVDIDAMIAEGSDHDDATEQSDADYEEADETEAEDTAYPDSHIMTDEEEKEFLAMVMGGGSETADTAEADQEDEESDADPDLTSHQQQELEALYNHGSEAADDAPTGGVSDLLNDILRVKERKRHRRQEFEEHMEL